MTALEGGGIAGGQTPRDRYDSPERGGGVIENEPWVEVETHWLEESGWEVGEQAPPRRRYSSLPSPPPPSLFQSYWLAGFESACQINSHRRRNDMLAATQHDTCAAEDYERCRQFGIRSVRDGVRWHLIDRGGRYDFSSLIPMADAAQRQGMQVLWNLCHYGWPEGIDIFSAQWVERYVKYVRAVARFFADRSDDVPFYCPMNEISFFTWSIATKGVMYPYAVGRAMELKRQLVRATLAGIEAIWEVDRRARIVYAEPLINVVTPLEFPELWSVAEGERESQFEAWDMLCGRCHEDLGGDLKYLDVMGLNFYASNQWDALGGFVLWHVRPLDERWMPLHLLLQEVYERYRRPLFLAETSHVGVGRGEWIREIADEVARARENGVPLEGICLYPIIDRPDWDDCDRYHNSGLWDLCRDGDCQRRVLCEDYARDLRAAQRRLAAIGCV